MVGAAAVRTKIKSSGTPFETKAPPEFGSAVPYRGPAQIAMPQLSAALSATLPECHAAASAALSAALAFPLLPSGALIAPASVGLSAALAVAFAAIAVVPGRVFFRFVRAVVDAAGLKPRVFFRRLVADRLFGAAGIVAARFSGALGPVFCANCRVPAGAFGRAVNYCLH